MTQNPGGSGSAIAGVLAYQRLETIRKNIPADGSRPYPGEFGRVFVRTPAFPAAPPPLETPSPLTKTGLPPGHVAVLTLAMARRSERSGRGPGRRQIAAWLDISVEHVLEIARGSGIADPPDRRLLNFTAPGYLTHADRSAIVHAFIGDAEIEAIAARFSRSRAQMLGILRRMGLPVGRGGALRDALRREIADSAVPLISSPGVVRSPSGSTNPASPSPSRNRIRGRPPGRLRKCRGRPPKSRPPSPSPAYPDSRAEPMITKLLSRIGEKLDLSSRDHLVDVIRHVYRAASNGEPIVAVPGRGVTPYARECLSVLYVAGVAPGGCAQIVGVSTHTVARVFSNFLGSSECGRSNRSAWPGQLSPGFDLAKIATSYGVENFTFKKCLSSGILFPVRRADLSRIFVAPHYSARLNEGITC